MPLKLKHSDIPELRAAMLKQQGGLDPITSLRIKDPVLDHDHDTGHIRATLQRETNAFEGKVVNAFRRYMRHQGCSIEDVLINLIEYWQIDYSRNPLHPKHRTPGDKKVLDYKRRIKRAKRESTKQKYRDLIKSIKDEVV